MSDHPLRIVYCTPSLYIAGGVERVLTTKANYLADVLGHDVHIILTDGKGEAPYFPLSPRVKITNLDIGFEELWHLNFVRKALVYLSKQRRYKVALRKTLLSLHPDITISMGRREVNFLCSIPDGSRKICEIHVNRAHYRNFEADDSNWLKDLFARIWMQSLVGKLKRFDRVVCLTERDAASWHELTNVTTIPNPLPPQQEICATTQRRKSAIAVGRYTYQKGFDLLLMAWQTVRKQHPDWHLHIYGDGDRTPYQQQCDALGLSDCCHLHAAHPHIREKYAENSMLVVSSRFEGFGMIIIEAMQCGLPVVSFDCPYGPRDIISDGYDGVLAHDGDPIALANGICQLIDDEPRRQRMAHAASATAHRYDVDNIMLQWQQRVLLPLLSKSQHAKPLP